jgi:hypothetical protein
MTDNQMREIRCTTIKKKESRRENFLESILAVGEKYYATILVREKKGTFTLTEHLSSYYAVSFDLAIHTVVDNYICCTVRAIM